MDISLGGLRDVALALRSWNSSGSVFDDRTRLAARTTASELTSKIPNALLPDEETAVFHADTLGSTVGAQIRATTDPWVMEFTDNSNRVLADTASTTTFRPVTTGIWDGIMHLEIQDPDGVWHRRQSRTWWFVTDPDLPTTWYVSLDRRWRPLGSTDTAMGFRIHQYAFWLRSDVHDNLAPGIIWDETRQQSWPLETGTAWRHDMRDFRGESQSAPYILFRGRGFQMPTPYFIPTLTPGNAASWAGPWQEGTFTFLWTLCWGYKDDEWQELPGGLREPTWESAPSPVSAAFDHTVAANQGRSIVVALPNIDAAQNFGVVGTLRIGRSGFFARTYVAQTAIRTGGAGLADFSRVETPGIYYPLGDTDFDGTAASFTWTGADIPDRLRQLRRAARYFGWQAYPHQDSRYEMDIRVLRKVPEFVNDADTLPLHEVFQPAFLHLFLYHMCLMDGVDIKSADHHLKRFEALVEIPRDVDESPAEVIEPVPWGGDEIPDRYSLYAEEI